MRVLVREVAFREHQTAAGRKGVVNVPVLLMEEYQNDCSVTKWDLLGLQVRCSSCITRGLCWGRSCVDLQFLYLKSTLDEGFMCKAWCFRAGWNWWPEPRFILQLPTCSTELQFVELL